MTNQFVSRFSLEVDENVLVDIQNNTWHVVKILLKQCLIMALTAEHLSMMPSQDVARLTGRVM